MIPRIVAVAIFASSHANFISNSARVIEPLFQYKFSRVECISGYAKDSSNGTIVFGDLKIDTSAVDCNGRGVEARSGILRDERVLSSKNSSILNEILRRGNGWTVEAWATFHDFSDCPSCEYRHIVSVSSVDMDHPRENCGSTSNFLLYQSNIESSVGMLLSGGPQCQSTKAHSLVKWGSPVHIAFTSNISEVGADTIQTQWYIDGKAAGEGQLKDTLPHWSGGFYLQLLNDAVSIRNSSQFAAPKGSVFLFALYNRALSHNEVAQNFHAGLDNSPPVAENITVTINEDGEVGDHYATPQFYEQGPGVPTLDLPIINLVVLDLDKDKSFPSAQNSTKGQGVVTIDSLPSKGELYDVHGKVIKFVPWEIAHDGGFMLRYRPVKDEFSGPSDVYTSLRYSAVDAVTGEVSVVPGFVTIYVLPKNDPPIPTNVSETVTLGESHFIFLNGTDVDTTVGDRINGAMVVEAPEYGLLHQVFENGTRSKVPVKSGDQLWSRVTSYSPCEDTGRLSCSFSMGHIMRDRFTFRIFDSSNASSTVGLVSLVLKSSLEVMTAQSQNDTSWRCIEDEESVINMFVRDYADISRSVALVISAVPDHGNLSDVKNNRTLTLGDGVLSMCLEGGLCISSIRYRPEKDYYNFPNMSGKALHESSGDCFKFYAVAQESGEHSEEITQEIQVINRNDPSSIQCPSHVGGIKAVGTGSFSSHAEYFHLDRIALSGFTLVDPDLDIDVIKVMVRSNFGLLTLNQSYVGLLDFSSMAYCFEAGTRHCSGSGSSDRETVFVALPSKAIMALDGMVYQSLSSGVLDSVNITILDGVDGECLSQARFETESLRGACWGRSCSIRIPVQSRWVQGSEKRSVDWSMMIWVWKCFGFIMLAFISLEWCIS